MSQEIFAEKINLHRNSLARIENGSSFVSAETLENIKRISKVEYKDLFAFDDKIGKNYHKAFESRLYELDENDIKYFLVSIDAYLEAKKERA